MLKVIESVFKNFHNTIIEDARNPMFIELPHREGLPPLETATEKSTGLDLVCALPEEESISLRCAQRVVKIPTGIKINPEYRHRGNTDLQIRSRSGLSLSGVVVANAPGTIDWDYEGEIFVLIAKITSGEFTIKRGMKIAQLVEVITVPWGIREITDLKYNNPSIKTQTSSIKKKREGGFGSTGE